MKTAEEKFIDALIDCRFIEDTDDDKLVISNMLKAYAQQAISEREGWRYYDKDKHLLKVGTQYLVQFGDNSFAIWYHSNSSIWENEVIAFHELPAPYQPEGGEV